MYRVFLIPTDEEPRKEVWIEAVAVRESPSGQLWEFLAKEGHVVAFVTKALVSSFVQAVDRRKPRLKSGEKLPERLAWVSPKRERRVWPLVSASTDPAGAPSVDQTRSLPLR